MNPLLSPDAPTERGADYSEAFSGIDAIEGQGLDNPMGSAMPAPVAAPTPAPAPEPTPVAATITPAAEAPKPKVEDLFNLDRFTPKKEEPAPAAKTEPAKPEPTSIKQFREQYEMNAPSLKVLARKSKKPPRP